LTFAARRVRNRIPATGHELDYNVMRVFLTVALRRLFRIRIDSGAQTAVPKPCIVVANHESLLDAVLLALFLPLRATVVVAPEEAARPLMRWALRFVAHEVLDIAQAASLKPLLRLIRAGHSIALFPEGRLKRSGAVSKVYPVPALLAARSGASVLPLLIRGLPAEAGGNALTRLMRRVLCGITLQCLPPRQIDAALAGSARQRRARATRELTAIMQEAAVAGCAYRSLFETFLDACRHHGRRAPLIEDPKQGVQSYGTILRGSLAIGRLLKRYTLDKERVGVLLPNVPATVQTVLGLSGAGRVPVMLNYSGGESAVRTARAAAGVRTVITSRRFVDQARLQVLIGALDGCTIVYLEDLRAKFGPADKLWLVCALWFPRRVIARPAASDPAVVLFTSGSEGEAKGVVLPHQAIVANVMQMRTVIEFTPQDKILNPLPLYHAYSFTAGMALPLITGTRLYLYISPLHYRAIPEIAYRNDCTVLFGTSTFLSYYATHAQPADFARLRYVISGGEKLAPEVSRVWMEKFGLRILEGYGCTECAPVISLASPNACRAGTVGRLLPMMRHHIEPVCDIEKGGVLHLKGPNVMLGHYLREAPGVLRPCGSAQGPGWYDTGDIVEIDDEGYITIQGRVRRFAKIAGEMVSLDHVEQLARLASPAHFHAAVLTLEEYGGETTLLFTTDPALDRIALQKAARAIGSRELAVAREIVRVTALPVLGNGKIDYGTLGGMARSRRSDTRRSGAVAAAQASLRQGAAPRRPGTNEPETRSELNAR